jgi:hypothetical protein
MKKVIAAAFLLIAVGACLLFYFFQSGEYKVKEYAKSEYGLDVEIIEKTNTGFPSDTEYLVFPKNHEDLEFTIIVPFSDGGITDNYSRALVADKELHRLKKVMSDVKDLGFSPSGNGELKVDFVKMGREPDANKYLVHLNSGSPIKIASFENEELDRYLKLTKLIKQSGASVHRVIISDGHGHDSKSITLNMDELKNTNSKEDLLNHIIRSNWKFASYYENKKWESKKEKVENERFTFGSKYDEYWFNCREMNENGVCTNIFVQVEFKDNSLNKENPYLEEDINSIVQLFKEIAPKANIEYSFIEEGSDDSTRFTGYEMKKFDDTSSFIDKYFK